MSIIQNGGYKKSKEKAKRRIYVGLSNESKIKSIHFQLGFPTQVDFTCAQLFKSVELYKLQVAAH